MAVKLRLALFVMALIAAQMCLASKADREDSSQTIRGLVLLETSADSPLEPTGSLAPSERPMVSTDALELQFDIDPKDLEELGDSEILPSSKPTFSAERLLYESKRMRHYKYQSKLKREIVIPTSIEDLDLLQSLDSLTVEEQNLFFAKKEKLLNRVAKTCGLLKMKYKNTNKFISLVNKMLYTNAPLVVRSIRNKTRVSLGISVGLGLNDKILEKIKKLLSLERVPDISGFYLMTSVGMTLSYYEKNGVKKMRFSSFNIENRWAKEIYAPFVVAAGGLVLQWSKSNKLQDESVTRGEFFHTAALNLDRSSSEYGVTIRALVPAVPGGATAVFRGEYANYQLTPSGIAQLTGDTFRFLWPTQKNRCLDVLNASARF